VRRHCKQRANILRVAAVPVQVKHNSLKAVKQRHAHAAKQAGCYCEVSLGLGVASFSLLILSLAFILTAASRFKAKIVVVAAAGEDAAVAVGAARHYSPKLFDFGIDVVKQLPTHAAGCGLDPGLRVVQEGGSNCSRPTFVHVLCRC
jgi:hypothetical protein